MMGVSPQRALSKPENPKPGFRIPDPSAASLNGDNLKVIYFIFSHRNDKVVGYLRRGGSGYSINRSLGMGYVDLKYKAEGQTIKDYILQGHYEIDVMGKKYKADVTLNPLFDPKKLKMKL